MFGRVNTPSSAHMTLFRNKAGEVSNVPSHQPLRWDMRVTRQKRVASRPSPALSGYGGGFADCVLIMSLCFRERERDLQIGC